MAKVQPGDIIIFHVLKPINGIVAIGRVKSTMFESYTDIWGKNRYPFRIKVEILNDFIRQENNPIPISALIGLPQNSELEIEPYLRNVWITKITKQQYHNLMKSFNS